MKQQSILIYLYADNMAIEGPRPEGFWQVTKDAPYLQDINQIPLLNVTSNVSID